VLGNAVLASSTKPSVSPAKATALRLLSARVPTVSTTMAWPSIVWPAILPAASAIIRLAALPVKATEFRPARIA